MIKLIFGCWRLSNNFYRVCKNKCGYIYRCKKGFYLLVFNLRFCVVVLLFGDNEMIGLVMCFWVLCGVKVREIELCLMFLMICVILRFFNFFSCGNIFDSVLVKWMECFVENLGVVLLFWLKFFFFWGMLKKIWLSVVLRLGLENIGGVVEIVFFILRVRLVVMDVFLMFKDLI